MSESDERRRSGETPDPAHTSREDRERRVSFSRRALLRAGWTVPVAVTLAVPLARGQGLGHGDAARGGGSEGPIHGDWTHNDEVNHQDAGHVDSFGHQDSPNHTDSAHSDHDHLDGTGSATGQHFDHNHADGSHSDQTTHGDSVSHHDSTHSDLQLHSDSTHQDTP